MPECFGEPVVTNSCAFLLCPRGCGCADAPGIPCALGFWGEQYSKPGRETSREGGSVACVAWFELWNRNRCLWRPRARGDPKPPIFVVTLNSGSSLDNHKRLWLWVPARASLGRDDGDPRSRAQLRTRRGRRRRDTMGMKVQPSHPAGAVIDRRILVLR